MSKLANPVNTRIATTRSGQYKRVLGTPALVLFGLAYMVPLTVFTTLGYVSVLSEGHVAAAYVVTLATMLFTALSYGAMVRARPSSGSAYAYVRTSFGPNTGFLVGWTMMLDYILMPMICYLFFGVYLNAYFPDVPMSVWIAGAVVLVTALNVLGIKLVSRMNLILVGVQIVFVAVFVMVAVRAAGQGEVPSPLSPFFTPDMPVGGVLAGAAMLCLSFLGFDAVSTLSEETTNPRVRIPRAIILCTLIGGGLYMVISYAAQMVHPSYSFENVDAASLEVMNHAGGPWLSAFFTAAYCAGLFACAMASQASVSRVIYAMGRDGALPKKFFGKLNVRFSTPVNATLASGAFGLTALFVDGDLATSVISFGALTAFTLVNLSVIKHYLIDKGRRGAKSIVLYGLMPLIGTGLTVWLWTNLSGMTFLIGFIWVAIGLAVLAMNTNFFRRKMPTITLDEAEIDESGTAGVEGEAVPASSVRARGAAAAPDDAGA